ncbi:hypothetical protein GCM10023144_26550 [Pigmentiphaga soli]|uniref:Thioredoxin domain-containing protein n=1 Tax=Pigmentiphaga soli TaxID=1007095 RepID=A0ABP8H4R3_9BURK
MNALRRVFLTGTLPGPRHGRHPAFATYRRLLQAAALLCASAACAIQPHAQALPAAGPDTVAFVQRPGAALPLDAALRDEAGRAVRLGSYFGAEPVVLVLGYYHCPMLCSTLMDGVIESLHGIGVDYRVVGVGIDPAETPADAAARHAAYQGLLDPEQRGRLHLLTGAAAPVARIARAVGFHYRRDPATGQYAHPAGFVVATPDGTVSRYFPGVRFAPRDLRLALVEASRGTVGSVSDRLFLLCAHYDPQRGRYTLAAMTAARAAGLAVLAVLAAMLWRLRGKGGMR